MSVPRTNQKEVSEVSIRKAVPEIEPLMSCPMMKIASAMRDIADCTSHVHAFVRLGGIEKFLDALEYEEETVKHQILKALTAIVFYNTDSCARVGNHEKFPDLIKTALRAKGSPHYQDAAIVCATCVMAGSWECHERMRPLITEALEAARDDLILKADCVRFFNNMSANPENRPHLQVVVPFLVEVMGTADLSLASTSACCAVANIIDKESAHLLNCLETGKLVLQLMTALDMTLQGFDYPRNSKVFYDDWKLCHSLANLSRLVEDKEVLLLDKLVPLLGKAIMKHNESSTPQASKLREHALETLWLVSRG